MFFFTSVLLSGCATNPVAPTVNNTKAITSEQRTKNILKYDQWKLKGKIAFIQQNSGKSKRESASLTWQVNETKQTQELNLSSYLGINVLHLRSSQNQHLIKVDGKEYKASNLPELIYSLTGLTLPTEALAFWLKSLPYKADDKVQINSKTQLPQSLTSNFHNSIWKIDFDKYQRFNNIEMATKFTIKKDDLLIKVVVNKWSFID